MAVLYPGGLSHAYADNAISSMTTDVYQTYLSLLSLSTYLVDTDAGEPGEATVLWTVPRFFVWDSGAYALAAALYFFAMLALRVLVVHWHSWPTSKPVAPSTMTPQGFFIETEPIVSCRISIDDGPPTSNADKISLPAPSNCATWGGEAPKWSIRVPRDILQA
ncbi:hypothetical protein BC834DRAFT_159663 [Gloeopeniophorella convolvens]|nr:hypothetical protein BC834DRAFT_159663 [Gloeopeniophorella convolvens]